MTLDRGNALSSPDLTRPLSSQERSHLMETARKIRRDLLFSIAEAGSGHSGGSLSETDILTTLYYKVLRHNPQDPHFPDRDRFILSKAHACPGLYTVLAHRGYFPLSDLSSFRKIDSNLQGHAKIDTPGVEMSGGSLGMGLSFGIGVALAGRVDGKSYHTYVLLGDGECDEGQIWEAAMSAAHYKIDTVTAIVDRNRIQNDRFTHEVMELEPLAQKWRSFGWRVLTVNGHSIPALYRGFQRAREVKGQPTAIIANTVKGKGVSFMENNPGFHGKAPSWEQAGQATIELGFSAEEAKEAMTETGYAEQSISALVKEMETSSLVTT